jgi:hypothetical protein
MHTHALSACSRQKHTSSPAHPIRETRSRCAGRDAHTHIHTHTPMQTHQRLTRHARPPQAFIAQAGTQTRKYSAFDKACAAGFHSTSGHTNRDTHACVDTTTVFDKACAAGFHSTSGHTHRDTHACVDTTTVFDKACAAGFHSASRHILFHISGAHQILGGKIARI